jgi:hypothetical protein
MANHQLYGAIFQRKSVRKYDMTSLPATALAQLQKFASTAKPLDENIKYEFSYLGTTDIPGIKHYYPHVISNSIGTV